MNRYTNALGVACCALIACTGTSGSNGTNASVTVDDSYLTGLSIPVSTRLPFPMVAGITNLAPGLWDFGLCAKTTDVHWSNNDYVSTVAVLYQSPSP